MLRKNKKITNNRNICYYNKKKLVNARNIVKHTFNTVQ